MTPTDRVREHVARVLNVDDPTSTGGDDPFKVAVVRRLDTIIQLLREQRNRDLQEYLDFKSVAIYMGVSERTVQRLCGRGSCATSNWATQETGRSRE